MIQSFLETADYQLNKGVGRMQNLSAKIFSKLKSGYNQSAALILGECLIVINQKITTYRITTDLLKAGQLRILCLSRNQNKIMV